MRVQLDAQALSGKAVRALVLKFILMKKSIRARGLAPAFSVSVLSLACGAAWAQSVSEVNPVVVTATRMEQPLSDVLQAVTVITKDEITRSNASDVSELLAGQAGIEFARSGGLGSPISIYMRGAGSTQTMVLVDGIPFSAQDATGSASPIYMIPLNQIDHIEILRGNASAIYGAGAVGGVINLITNSGSSTGFNPSASIAYGRYNSTRTTVGFDGGDENTKYSFAVGRNQSHGFEAVSSAKYPAVNPSANGYQQDSFRFAITQKIDAQNSLGVKFLQSDGLSSFDNNYADSPSQVWESKAKTQLTQIYSKNKINQDWSSSLSLSHSQNDQKTLTDGVFNSLYGRYITNHDVWNWTNTYSLTKNHMLNFGYERDESSLSTDAVDWNGVSTNINKTSVKSRAFIGVLSTVDKLFTQVNLSHETMPQEVKADTYLIGAGYLIDSNLKLSMTHSTAISAPTLGQLYDYSSGGNGSLKPEHSNSSEIGLQYMKESTYSRIVMFDTKYKDLIAVGSTPVQDTYFANQGINQFENVNSAHNTGLEFQLKQRFDKVQVNLNYTHQTPVNEAAVVVQNKARNFGNFDLNYLLNEKSDIGAGIVATSSRMTTGPDSVKTNTAGYSVMRIHSTYKLSPSTKIVGSLENVFDKQYFQIYGYNTPGRGLYLTLQYQPK